VGIFALGAWAAYAQTPAKPRVASPPSGAVTVQAPAARPVNADADTCPLCFKSSGSESVVAQLGTAKAAAPAPSGQPDGPRVDPPAAAPAAAPSATPSGPRVIEQETAAPRPAPATPRVSANGKPLKTYVIGPLDVLEGKVWNNANLSNIADVRTDGLISMPLVGEVVASGLTVSELTAAIKEKLNSVIIEPEVNIQVIRYNSKKYSIFGGCYKQGEFPLVGEVTVLDAFANCGGFKDFANLKGVYILRGGQKLKFNYKDVIKGKHMEQNIPLESGDRIVIPE